MERIKPIKQSEFTVQQKQVFDQITSSRPSIAGPFIAWLYSPEFADKAQSLGEFVRFHTSLSSRLSELAILCVARFWNCTGEWDIHVPFAKAAGIDDQIITAINHKDKPLFKEQKEEVLHNYIIQLLEKKFVDDKTFTRLSCFFDQKAIVEITGLVGYYSMVALSLNAFLIQPPTTKGFEPSINLQTNNK
ncbi:MAG: hypothetical protein HQ521_01950 [Bacteroidetes bacterium]|nr:hypothetical protein [Bacteroidota bacterium]